MALRNQKEVKETDLLIIFHLSHNVLSRNVADGFRRCGCHGELSVNLHLKPRQRSLRKKTAVKPE